MLTHVRAFWTFTLEMSETVWVKSRVLIAPTYKQEMGKPNSFLLKNDRKSKRI